MCAYMRNCGGIRGEHLSFDGNCLFASSLVCLLVIRGRRYAPTPRAQHLDTNERAFVSFRARAPTLGRDLYVVVVDRGVQHAVCTQRHDGSSVHAAGAMTPPYTHTLARPHRAPRGRLSNAVPHDVLRDRADLHARRVAVAAECPHGLQHLRTLEPAHPPPPGPWHSPWHAPEASQRPPPPPPPSATRSRQCRRPPRATNSRRRPRGNRTRPSRRRPRARVPLPPCGRPVSPAGACRRTRSGAS